MMLPCLWGFLFPAIGLGQTVIDRIDQHTDIVHYDEVIPLGDDSWLFSGRGNVSGGQPTDMYFITKCDDTGTPLWKYGHYLMPTSHWGNNSPIRAKQISVLPDDGVFFIGVYDECDVVTGQGAAIRLNNTGEHMWHWEFTFSDFNHIPGTHHPE